MTVGYLNATINRNTRQREPESETDRSSHTRPNPRVDRYGYGLDMPRSWGSGFWTILETNRTIHPVQTRTPGGIPTSIANTVQHWNS